MSDADVDTTGSDAGAAAGNAGGGAAKGTGDGAGKGAATATGDAGGAAAKSTAQDTLASGAAGDGEVTTPADWPSDWRERIAGSNKDYLKELSRYDSPPGVWKKVKNLEKALSQRAVDKPRPTDEEAEELKAWRAEKGIPEAPEGYIEKLELANGKVLGELDKPVAEQFAKFAFENDIPKGITDKVINYQLEYVEGLQAQQAEQDETFRDESLTALKEEYGADYKRNINAISTLFTDAPEGLVDRIILGRTADGRKFGDDPEVVKWLVGIAKAANPAATLVPQGGGDSTKGLEQQIAEIESYMHTNRAEYFKDEAKQTRYRELLDARAKLQSRAA